jgi:hypothetical protein
LTLRRKQNTVTSTAITVKIAKHYDDCGTVPNIVTSPESIPFTKRIHHPPSKAHWSATTTLLRKKPDVFLFYDLKSIPEAVSAAISNVSNI